MKERLEASLISGKNSQIKMTRTTAGHRLLPTLIALTMALAPAQALETWEKLDKRLKTQVYELNTGLKLHLKDGLWAYIADLSPKGHFPVYSTSRDDKGYRVIANGSSFPVKTSQHDKTYFVTNQHVVEGGNGVEVIKECERFYAAMKLYAEQNGGNNADGKYKELLQIVNLSTKGGKNLVGAERQQYEATVDAIWDTYETYLSKRADPGRVMFQKYLKQAGLEKQLGYFLHAPGPITQPAIEAKLYKCGRPDTDGDIAILTTSSATVVPLELDSLAASEGQEIQVIGYPKASEQIELQQTERYAPTLSTGHITRVLPRLLQVDAPVTNGSSGGPVVGARGKVLGVVALRAMSLDGVELPKFVGAVPAHLVESFAPELFSKVSAR